MVMLRIRCLCAMHPWYFCDNTCTSLKTQFIISICVQVRMDWVTVCSAGRWFLKLMTETPETVPRIKNSQYLFYVPNERNNIVNCLFWKFEVWQNFNQNMIILKCQRRLQLGILCNYCAKTTPIQGTVILRGTVKIIPALLTIQITWIFGWDI